MKKQSKQRGPDELDSKAEALRRSHEELEATRNRAAFLYDFAPVGYFTFDQDGTVCSVNRVGEQMLGVDRTELIGENFVKFVGDEECFVFSHFIQTVFAGHGKGTCRLRLAKKDPEPLFVRIDALVTESSEECLAVLVDITEKKRAEKALYESEYNLAKAQSMTHVGSWSYDPESGKVHASAELLRIMQLRPEDTDRESFGRTIHPDDREEAINRLRLSVEHGKSYEIEHRLKFDDGSLRWVYTIVETSVNSAGKVLKLYGTTQDITQRKQAEVELRNKTNELQAIFDSIGDGIAVYDHDGRIQHHNRISPQLFPTETLPGKSCGAIFHADTPALPKECPVERALKGRRVDSSMILEREGQETQYLDITATPIKDALGEKNRALVFFRDVSEKRMQEMHLIQSEKMSSIGVLATGIAHEINNPLTSVAGFAEALQRRFRDAPDLKKDSRMDVFPHYLDVIIRESYRCKDIIDHLLNFGRKSGGTAIKVDLNRILTEIFELLRYHPTYRQTKIVPSLQPDLSPVLGDPSGLRQVCMNLVVNAHQAINGLGRVEVETGLFDAQMMFITIRDNGCGMSQEILDRIWEPFFTTKDVGKGIGLGLALTYNIVKRHGGEIRVTSRVGEGSQFMVLLPVCNEE
ncbi:MAG: PAS domain S-box protein [Desulfuromonadaceae bacterium]